MARNNGPKCKLCRREGMKLYLKGPRCDSPKCSLEKRNFPPGEHNWRRAKYSEYGVRLREKQKLKRIFGTQERQFKRYFGLAERGKGDTSANLLQLMERRLDNVVQRLGFALSRIHARQMIVHGFIDVNGKRLNKPSYLVKIGDEIQPHSKDKCFKKIRENLEINKGFTIPPWLELDPQIPRGKITRFPARDEFPYDIQEQLIVELCSK